MFLAEGERESSDGDITPGANNPHQKVLVRSFKFGHAAVHLRTNQGVPVFISLWWFGASEGDPHFPLGKIKSRHMAWEDRLKGSF